MFSKKSISMLFVLIALALVTVACTSNDAAAGIEDGATVDWETAVEIVNSGEVEMAFQTHSLDVTLMLKDGRRIETVEPGIDDIMDVIDACGSPCQNIAIATE